MFSGPTVRFVAAVLTAGVGLAMAVSALAEPTKVTEIKGKNLHLYSDGGKRVESIDAAKVNRPLPILEISAKGKYKVEIPGKGVFWILKAQTVTDEGAPEVTVNCQQITKSFASTRGFGDCK